MHGVIARICPEARVIDLGHGVQPQDVAGGGRRLARALPYVPAGVHLAVVDPGVGGPRRAVALRAGDRLLVGPDNGLLMAAAERFGGVDEAVDVSASPWRLEPVSATFHGRDVFAPVAARLAAGAALADGGERIDPATLVRLRAPRPRRQGAGVVAHAVEIDGFGNVVMDAALADLAGARRARIGVGGRRPRGAFPGGPARAPTATVARTFGDVPAGELVLYEDSGGSLALALNGGSAAAALGVRAGAELSLEPA